jgi:hypothetical protein
MQLTSEGTPLISCAGPVPGAVSCDPILRASVGHTCVSSRNGVRRTGHINRRIRTSPSLRHSSDESGRNPLPRAASGGSSDCRRPSDAPGSAIERSQRSSQRSRRRRNGVPCNETALRQRSRGPVPVGHSWAAIRRAGERHEGTDTLRRDSFHHRVWRSRMQHISATARAGATDSRRVLRPSRSTNHDVPPLAAPADVPR